MDNKHHLLTIAEVSTVTSIHYANVITTWRKTKWFISS